MTGFAVHGGRMEEALAHFGGDASGWIDLSTGINPCPWPGARDIRPDWRVLPDPHALRRLEVTAADFFGVDPALCCAVPGSEAGLRALSRILSLPARFPGLTYGSYAQAFDRACASHDGPAVQILANPNNPDGRLYPRETLVAVLEEQERAGGWLLVDEAFTDCHPDSSIAALVGESRSLIVTRSFGKFFGLAGARLGFVLAPLYLLREIKRMLGDWPLCSAALAFGSGAYADLDWIGRTRIALGERAAALDTVLARHGLPARGACPLFRLTDAGSADLFAILARAHILTRPFAAQPDVLRFGLPADAAALARLDDALSAWSAHD
ncbi:cobalamin biosynthetic protein CobC [Sphingobium sp. OAS761]|uniref:aminotransferase class I/II-fold pyridoxal phosphate-dependent enzyme n=1 Tax=Sphingobium sp. OAS761 TaxID=2817901 RepID=UPI00209DAC50|nr:aminotransferase class I/II-fold pyridoxal phosphate-dependent enzyme [Sphingobium sp. OAS761]MCP1469513.1 cobalamin biosynthetic protein CobC [Sphingobium sp. OAS761]